MGLIKNFLRSMEIKKNKKDNDRKELLETRIRARSIAVDNSSLYDRDRIYPMPMPMPMGFYEPDYPAIQLNGNYMTRPPTPQWNPYYISMLDKSTNTFTYVNGEKFKLNIVIKAESYQGIPESVPDESIKNRFIYNNKIDNNCIINYDVSTILDPYSITTSKRIVVKYYALDRESQPKKKKYIQEEMEL